MEPEELVRRIKAADQMLREAFDRFKDDPSPRYSNVWTVRHVFAHILWYEEEIANLLEAVSLASTSPYWSNEHDLRNTLVDTEMADVTMDEIGLRREEATARICQLLEGLETEDLTEPEGFDMPPDWTPWQIIAQNTYEHYRDHLGNLGKLMHE